jgi:hypothetical protein
VAGCYETRFFDPTPIPRVLSPWPAGTSTSPSTARHASAVR